MRKAEKPTIATSSEDRKLQSTRSYTGLTQCGAIMEGACRIANNPIIDLLHPIGVLVNRRTNGNYIKVLTNIKYKETTLGLCAVTQYKETTLVGFRVDDAYLALQYYMIMDFKQAKCIAPHFIELHLASSHDLQ